MSATLPGDVPTQDASADDGSRNADRRGTFLERYGHLPSDSVPGALPGLSKAQTYLLLAAVGLYLVWRYV